MKFSMQPLFGALECLCPECVQDGRSGRGEPRAAAVCCSEVTAVVAVFHFFFSF